MKSLLRGAALAARRIFDPRPAISRGFFACAALALGTNCVVIDEHGAESFVTHAQGGQRVRNMQDTFDVVSRHVVSEQLGQPRRFLVGLGNDITAAEGWDPNRAHAWELGQKLDIHYLYLSGLDWPHWTPKEEGEGAYITNNAEAALARGVTPMFTLYQAAEQGENKLEKFDTPEFMTKYWNGVRVMYTRLGMLGAPSIVHLEPDLWGYFQQRSDSPSAVPVRVGSIVPECNGLPEDASGFGRCLVKLGRALAPQTSIALSASSFGAYYPNTAKKSDPYRVAAYLNEVGATESDFMVVETLDRDAGCFERAADPLCQRQGNFYWDDDAFRQHLAWARTIHEETGKLLLWWQMPLGVPSDAFGEAGGYRDNRVQWLFAHPDEFVEAGGFGAVFGTGAPNQTSAKTDGGQFQRAIQRYYASPVWFGRR
jgi:hypothetical protein